MLQFLQATTTQQGLVVTATLTNIQYETHIKVSDEQMAALNLSPHATLPHWNYTIKPTST
jgi:hypothetical protein